MAASVAFYTQVHDFERGGGDPDDDDGDPSFAILTREEDRLFLSSHRGDGEFGQAIMVLTEDVAPCSASSSSEVSRHRATRIHRCTKVQQTESRRTRSANRRVVELSNRRASE